MVRNGSFIEAGIKGFRPGLTISNRAVGNVNVTFHAWERFCGRYYRPIDHGVLPVDFFLSEIKASFRVASKIQLSMRERLTHLLHHRNKEVLYLHDSKLNLVFVIDEREPKTLITVWER